MQMVATTKRAGMAVFTSDKKYCQSKLVTRDKDGHSSVIKRSIIKRL